MVILAMMLLGTLSLDVNDALINSGSTSLEMEAGLDALSYGQSLLDEILDKEYDQATTTGVRIFNYNLLTAPALLGPEVGETFTLPDTATSNGFRSIRKYNDVDDYNGYSRNVRNQRLDIFTLTSRVKYVSEDHPDSVLNTQTFYKRVSVTISNPYMVKDANGNVFPLVMRDLAIYRRYF
ncbi:MAG TPA: hypothetical protein VI758_11410, partial [Bacteroidota bacterium]